MRTSSEMSRSSKSLNESSTKLRRRTSSNKGGEEEKLLGQNKEEENKLVKKESVETGSVSFHKSVKSFVLYF